MSAGKGDKPRPVNKKNFDSNFDEIKWNKKTSNNLETKSKKGKTVIYYK
jgi:hypothetical protein